MQSSTQTKRIIKTSRSCDDGHAVTVSHRAIGPGNEQVYSLKGDRQSEREDIWEGHHKEATQTHHTAHTSINWSIYLIECKSEMLKTSFDSSGF